MRRLTSKPAAPALRAELKVAAVGPLEDPDNPRIEHPSVLAAPDVVAMNHDDGPRAVVVAQRVEAANGRRVSLVLCVGRRRRLRTLFGRLGWAMDAWYALDDRSGCLYLSFQSAASGISGFGGYLSRHTP